MAKSDWTFYLTGTVVHNLVTIPAPPVGLKWLHFALTAASGPIVAVPKQPPYPHADITRGLWRTLWRHDDASLRSQSGLLAVCSQDNMLPGQGGASYAVVFNNNTINATRTLSLVKFTNGIGDLIGGGASMLATASNLVWNLATTYALEWSWYLDMASLGGMVLSVQFGTAVDFSDLAPVAGLTDILVSTAVLTNAVSVGLYMANWNSNNCHLYVDQTSLETL